MKNVLINPNPVLSAGTLKSILRWNWIGLCLWMLGGTFQAMASKGESYVQSKTSEKGKQHPEYLKNPDNSPCSNCIELIDRRKADERFFVDRDEPAHFYVQKSYTPLHYRKSADGPWLSLNYRIREQAPGLFRAEQQPIQVCSDLNKGESSFQFDTVKFFFNRKMQWYFEGRSGYVSSRWNADYSRASMQNGGVVADEVFPGVSMEQGFDLAEIKTSWKVKTLNAIPVQADSVVLDDYLKIPEGCQLMEVSGGVEVLDASGRALFHYRNPSFYDQRFWGIRGKYQIVPVSADEAILRMKIPASWFRNPDNIYPLVIDPIVRGSDSVGYYWYLTNPQTPYGPIRFTSEALGTCDYNLTVNVPGMSKLVRAFTELEYKLSFDATCGNPPIPAPFCTFSQVRQTIVGPCSQPISLACNPALPPYTGTCTSDPTKVPGASPILIYDQQSGVPAFRNFLNCVPEQCPDYQLNFTLQNTDSTCGDVCGDKCAWGNIWIMTIEGRTIEAYITANKDQVCAGQPVTLTVHPSWGVPPYHYRWTNGMTDSIITIYPNQSLFIGATAFDTCGNAAIANDTLITVLQTPPADAGPVQYLCEGGTLSIGGNPTSDVNAGITWTAIPGSATSWLSAINFSNPQVTMPPGTVDTVWFIVRASNPLCFRLDTAVVISTANPEVQIDTTQLPRVCAGQTVLLNAPSGFSSYRWNTGSTDSVAQVNEPGNYWVTVTDSLGCSGTSNTVELFQIPLPRVVVDPDTTIKYGDTITLRTDLNLLLETDSFRWRIQQGLDCSLCPSPSVYPENDSYYLLEIYRDGCRASDSAWIKVILPNNYFVPNAFTPNNDGNNDDFYVQAQGGVLVVVFRVFNRWGEKVHDGAYPWNGFYKAQAAPMGVYAYELILKLFNNERVALKGSVTLIR